MDRTGSFGLRNLLDLSAHLGGGGLVEANTVFQPENPYRFQHAERPQRVGVRGVLGGLEADRDVALSAQVIDLGRLDFLDDAYQVGGVGKVA